LQRISAWNLFAYRGRMPFRASADPCSYSKWKSDGLFRLVKGTCVFSCWKNTCEFCVVTFSAILAKIFELIFCSRTCCVAYVAYYFFCGATIFASVSRGWFHQRVMTVHSKLLHLTIPRSWNFFFLVGFITVDKTIILLWHIHALYRHGAGRCNLSTSILWGNVHVAVKPTWNFDYELCKWLCWGYKLCLWPLCLSQPIFRALYILTGSKI